jgi:YHS domain-containing protein
MVKVVLWALLFLLVLRAASRLVSGILEGAGYRRQIGSQRGVGLVRDPVCGVFVVPAMALTAGSGRATKYFCSEKCRQEWSRR